MGAQAHRQAKFFVPASPRSLAPARRDGARKKRGLPGDAPAKATSMTDGRNCRQPGA
jgi:hypothetical protein